MYKRQTIGILGGGQLGQMLSMAAARLGFKTHIFEPSANPPASNVSSDLHKQNMMITTNLKNLPQALMLLLTSSKTSRQAH